MKKFTEKGKEKFNGSKTCKHFINHEKRKTIRK